MKDVYHYLVSLIVDNPELVERVAAYGILDDFLPTSKTAIAVSGLIAVTGLSIFIVFSCPPPSMPWHDIVIGAYENMRPSISTIPLVDLHLQWYDVWRTYGINGKYFRFVSILLDLTQGDYYALGLCSFDPNIVAVLRQMNSDATWSLIYNNFPINSFSIPQNNPVNMNNILQAIQDVRRGN